MRSLQIILQYGPDDKSENNTPEIINVWQFSSDAPIKIISDILISLGKDIFLIQDRENPPRLKMSLPPKINKEKEVLVDILPFCDLEHPDGNVPLAVYDVELNEIRYNGAWAFVCEDHFKSCFCSLGVGKGQKLILKGGD